MRPLSRALRTPWALLDGLSHEYSRNYTRRAKRWGKPRWRRTRRRIERREAARFASGDQQEPT